MNSRISFPPSAPSAKSAGNSFAEEGLAAVAFANLQRVMLDRRTTLRKHLRRTRDLLLPRRLSGQMELAFTSGSNVTEILEA